jgi:sigma-B regulation protein RsbU (phosphoserine phosphatase)
MDELLKKIRDARVSPEKLVLMAEASHILNSTIEYEELMKNVLQLVTRAVNAEAAIVYRYDPSQKDLKVRYYSGDQEPFHMIIGMGQGFVGWVAEHRQPVLTNDPQHDPRFAPEIQNVELRSIICYPLTLRGKFFGVVEAINKKDGVFEQADLDVFDLLSDQIAVAISNAQLYRSIKKQALQRKTLFEVSRQIMMPLSLDEVLHNILIALQKVIDFDAGGIYLIDHASGEIESISSIGYDKVLEPDLRLKIGQGVVGWVARTGEAELVPDTSQDTRYINARAQTRSEVVVPVFSDSRLIGVLNLEHDELNAFSADDLEILTTFASQAAISIERAKLHKYMLEQKKIEEQLSIARAIQQTFLPRKVPKIPGYDLWGANISSGEVGGDYYDFIQIVENQIGIAIADVSGKGIPASLIMASFRASLIAEIRNNYAIRTICQKVNNLMCESLEPENFVTAIYGVLDAKNSIFTFANCGHNPGLLLRADDRVEELLEGGILMGIRRDATYEERPLYIASGDLLCLFTDGVTEAPNPAGEQFETGRIIQILKTYRRLPAADIGAKMIEAVHAFAAEDAVLDDLTLIVLKRL